MAAWDDAVLVGVVARAHGNKGEVIINAHTDFPETRFRPGAELMTRRPDGAVDVLRVAAMRLHQRRPVVAFEGYASIGEAETLAGLELRTDAADANPLPEGAYFHRDLVGCAVVTEGGEAIGRVARVDGDGAASRLVVTGGRSEVLIPFAEEICTVDLGARRVTVRPPQGLLELNGDWR